MLILVQLIVLDPDPNPELVLFLIVGVGSRSNMDPCQNSIQFRDPLYKKQIQIL